MNHVQLAFLLGMVVGAAAIALGEACGWLSDKAAAGRRHRRARATRRVSCAAAVLSAPIPHRRPVNRGAHAPRHDA